MAIRTRVKPSADPHSRRASDHPLELDAGALESGISWEAMFGNDHPVELEIGCGKGWFVTRAAAAHPEVNWFAIDFSSEHLRRAIDRTAKAGLENTRFAKVRAEELLAEWVPPASLRGVHILYPDPWPKKRHHKRRLLGLQRGPETLRSLARVIVSGGWLSVATDHDEYAEAIIEVMNEATDFERCEEFYSATLLPDPDEPVTEFERKYRVEGRSRHRFSWRRSLVERR